MITLNTDGTYSIAHSLFAGMSFPTKAAATATIMADLPIVYDLLKAAEQASERAIEACDRMVEVEEKIAARYVRAAAQVTP